MIRNLPPHKSIFDQTHDGSRIIVLENLSKSLYPAERKCIKSDGRLIYSGLDFSQYRMSHKVLYPFI